MKTEFIEGLKPYLDRIPKREYSDEQIRNAVRRCHGRITFDQMKEKLGTNHHINCAMVLKAIENSWALYETPETLKDIIWVPDFISKGLLKECIYLADLGLIERQSIRFRKLQEKKI